MQNHTITILLLLQPAKHLKDNLLCFAHVVMPAEAKKKKKKHLRSKELDKQKVEGEGKIHLER